MKIKTFLLFSTSLLATSIFLIVFHTQQPQSLQTIVSQTHQQIKDLQENLNDGEATSQVEAEAYFQELGLDGQVEKWKNCSLPSIVTYALGENHAAVVAFIRDAVKLPFTLLVYNVGLTPSALAVVSNYCNSSKCMVVDLELSVYPSFVSDPVVRAFRPLVIQHALSRVGGIVFVESSYRWLGSGAELQALWDKMAKHGGVLAWPKRFAVTSLTHPRMFAALGAAPEDFLFVQMVDAGRLLLAEQRDVRHVMRLWVRCALRLECISPIGAQSGGCRFDKKPQYRYSGCHGHDASALNVLLARRFQFEESYYTYGGARRLWAPASPALATAPAAPPAPRNDTA